MAQKLTDTIIKNLPKPANGNRITYDESVTGLGVRVTAAGNKAFILNYRTRATGKERRYTIGSCDDWKIGAAREEAKKQKQLIDKGGDPLAKLEEERDAKTVKDLCQRYEERHLDANKKRPSSILDDKAMIRDYILPKLKEKKVADVHSTDVEDLHAAISKRGISGRPARYRANRVVALLSKMFSLALKWGWRDHAAGNPAKGIDRNAEAKRKRYLSAAELESLTAALAAHKDQQACNIVRLLLLTGARRDEVESMRWKYFDAAEGTWAGVDLDAGKWTKPASTTKQKGWHQVPLSAAAQSLLADLLAQAQRELKKGEKLSDYVFPGRGGKGHREEIKTQWRELCIAAELVDVTTLPNGKSKVTPNVRIHDLRHTNASVLVSKGVPLTTIGRMLGHSQVSTTARYAHLYDDPLREAAELASAALAPVKPAPEPAPEDPEPAGANVIPMKQRRK
ncbi:MAG: DUF4102 domain-containing protein [Mesorhizobium sp.]|nr:MAG: DUF4102 domain-containing protein [Mesorhizobium sp.]